MRRPLILYEGTKASSYVEMVVGQILVESLAYIRLRGKIVVDRLIFIIGENKILPLVCWIYISNILSVFRVFVVVEVILRFDINVYDSFFYIYVWDSKVKV